MDFRLYKNFKEGVPVPLTVDGRFLFVSNTKKSYLPYKQS